MNIALAGNPNSGKTTLFNALTGSNQFVGNWPGVTVEKKEGKLKKYPDITVTDLPGIYSLSPYTLEEVVARNFLLNEKPDAILNIVDGTNLERNLYLTTQLLELGIPVVVAINMIDLVDKKGDEIDLSELGKRLGCKVVAISALKGKGIEEAIETVISSKENSFIEKHIFQAKVEDVLNSISNYLTVAVNKKRFYAIKVFERDDKILEQLKLADETFEKLNEEIKEVEKEFDDDSESIITNERYLFIGEILKNIYHKQQKDNLTTSDKIDKIVTNRFLGLPIFALVMYLVYYIAMVGIGATLTDFTNDNIFGDGFHLFGIGTAEYEEIAERYNEANNIVEGYKLYEEENGKSPTDSFTYYIEDEETLEISEETATLDDYKNAEATLQEIGEEPDPADYGYYIPSIPSLIESLLDSLNTADWLKGLVLDGIVAGVGAVLGFVPQMLVLFLLLAILEDCGYMARIAFVLDRIFRKFGLSGKSFIPMLIGTGCGVPGIMASRTIENERDRRMTIMTTTFIPCSAKIPFISMIAGAIFNGSAWVATSAYFIGMAAIIISGIMLKKTKMFAGDPAPFVMELPAYHWPSVANVLRSMWERGSSFIKKAGTVILLSTIIVWFTSYFGFTGEGFRMLSEEELDQSILAWFGNLIAWIFIPLGWGDWRAAVASITGLIAKENIVGTMGILYGSAGSGTVWQNLANAFSPVSGYSFMVFNLLCAPCFAAIGAIKREMNNTRWTWFAIAYQCGFAYMIALMIYQFGSLFNGEVHPIGLVFALAVLAFMIYMIFFKKYRESTKFSEIAE